MAFKDLSYLLSAESRQRLEHHKERLEEYRQMPDTELARMAEYCMKNSVGGRLGCKWEVGAPVYDATMVDVIIPELIRRLRAKAKEQP